ncbi:MAG: DUF5131 family protein [Chryseotalea sp.]
MNKTKIEWTDYTWNPVVGCTKVSAGCRDCFAERLVNRFSSVWGMTDFTDVQEKPERLQQPLKAAKKLKGKKVFVCDMSDLMHHKVNDSFIIQVFEVIRSMPETTFQVLTKRPQRLWSMCLQKTLVIPDNCWIGVSVENQTTANERIKVLNRIPAKIKFLSVEPLIDRIEFDYDKHLKFIKWVIVGGETGKMARPMQMHWVESIFRKTQELGIAYFFKQWGTGSLQPLAEIDGEPTLYNKLFRREFPV